MPDRTTVVVKCFGGPLDGNEYTLPANEIFLAVVKPGKPLREFEPGELIPVDVERGRYSRAKGVDGKLYMLWEGWGK